MSTENLSELPEYSGYRTYVKEINKTPLLTRKEEIELSGRIKKGDKAALEKLVLANLRLVVKIVNDYPKLGLDVMDLISEGNAGLHRAAEKFDAKFGAKFSTYAAFWIKQRIKRVLTNDGRTIRMPVNKVDLWLRIGRVSNRLYQTLDREPTDEEIAEDMGEPIERIKVVRQAGLSIASLDAPLVAGDDTTGTLGDFILDNNAEAVGDDMQQREQFDLILECVDKLPKRERDIINRRFGLRGHEPHTLEEVAIRYGLTRERIRQIQRGAFVNLRKFKIHMEKSQEDLRLLGPIKVEFRPEPQKLNRSLRMPSTSFRVPTIKGTRRRNYRTS